MIKYAWSFSRWTMKKRLHFDGHFSRRQRRRRFPIKLESFHNDSCSSSRCMFYSLVHRTHPLRGYLDIVLSIEWSVRRQSITSMFRRAYFSLKRENCLLINEWKSFTEERMIETGGGCSNTSMCHDWSRKGNHNKSAETELNLFSFEDILVDSLFIEYTLQGKDTFDLLEHPFTEQISPWMNDQLLIRSVYHNDVDLSPKTFIPLLEILHKQKIQSFLFL